MSNEMPALFNGKRRVRVLMVDDSEADYLLAKHGVKQATEDGKSPFDIEMDHVDNAEIALRLIESKSHDLYLVDWKLRHPGDGLELIRQCVKKSLKGPYLVLSGIAEAMSMRDQTEMLRLGVIDFLDKTQISDPALARGICFAYHNFSSRRRGWKTTAAGLVGSIGCIAMLFGWAPQLMGGQSIPWLIVGGGICQALGMFLGNLFAADSSEVRQLSRMTDDLRKMIERK